MLYDGQLPVCCVFLWPFFSRPGLNLFPLLILQFRHKLFHLYLVFPLFLIYATCTLNPRVLLVALSFGSLDQVSVFVVAALGSGAVTLTSLSMLYIFELRSRNKSNLGEPPPPLARLIPNRVSGVPDTQT